MYNMTNHTDHKENAPMNIEKGFDKLNELIITCAETENRTSLW